MKLRTRARPRFSSVHAPRFKHPNEGLRNRLVYRQLEDALAYAAKRYARGTLVDIGCGLKPWKDLFSPFVSEYIGVDHAASPHGVAQVDVVATAYEIPLEDESAQTVLLSEVLEHLEWPHAALTEAFRILEPGGHVIIDTPFIWQLHEEPRDFFRYSPHGLRHLLTSAGFEVLEIEPLAGAWTTLALQLSYALQRYRRYGLTLVVDSLIRLVQWTAARWELVDFQPGFSWCHLAIARKPLRKPR